MEAGDRMSSFHISSPCVPLLGKGREEREKDVEKIIVRILSTAKNMLNNGNVIQNTSSSCVPLLGKEREEREKEVEKIIVRIPSLSRDPLNRLRIAEEIPRGARNDGPIRQIPACRQEGLAALGIRKI